MFKNIFSCEGRIRRTEYALSLIFFILGFCLSIFITKKYIDWVGAEDVTEMNLFFWILFFPFAYFFISQGTKRCHDVGKSGWYQIIPFYSIWLCVAEGEEGVNAFGSNPKEICTYAEVAKVRETSRF
ncbi:DUF805 domain-containing protein [Joostella sp. CR20]|uniref:DUF805 domain-containing protein n=1 Tax=Joostella sp. CR20 TaxID=2804312 RepID=UPI00313A8BB0